MERRKSSLKNWSLNQSSVEKSVSFSTVDVRDYSLCLGDNPAVSRGAAISLDWGYDDERTYEINNYECDRTKHRRSAEALKITSIERIHLLKDIGYSRGQIKEQTQKTHRDKERRIKTRRRVEHEVRFKSFVWRMVKAITFGDAAPVPKPKKFQGLCEETCLEVSEDDVTLTSTTSSRNSEIMITENC